MKPKGRDKNKDPMQHLYDSMDEDGRTDARNHKSPPRRFRASEAGNCVRQIYYRLAGKRPKPRDARGMMYGICGDVDHDVTRQLMNHHDIEVRGVEFTEEGEGVEKMFVRTDLDVKAANGDITTIQLTCRADGEIDTEHGPTLLEIKGMGFYQYDWLNKTYAEKGYDGALARVHEKHKKYVYQCTVTMKLTGHDHTYLLLKDRSTGTLGLHNKETNERTGIILDFDDELWDKIIQRFAYISRKLDEGKPPPQEYSEGSNECGWCEFRYLCHDADRRKAQGKKPYIVYPGPQVEEHHDTEDDDV